MSFGSECWYCYWGWSKPVAEIYQRAVEDIDNAIAPCEANDWTSPDQPEGGYWAMNYGPAHIVWSDENWDCAESCLKECDGGQFAGWDGPSLEIVRRSLRELMALPEDVRECEPTGYDGANPQNFPPTCEVVRVKSR